MSNADLKYPTYNESDLVASNKPLFEPKEMASMLDATKGGKGLFWNNFFVDIGKGKTYQGQW